MVFWINGQFLYFLFRWSWRASTTWWRPQIYRAENMMTFWRERSTRWCALNTTNRSNCTAPNPVASHPSVTWVVKLVHPQFQVKLSSFWYIIGTLIEIVYKERALSHHTQLYDAMRKCPFLVIIWAFVITFKLPKWADELLPNISVNCQYSRIRLA